LIRRDNYEAIEANNEAQGRVVSAQPRAVPASVVSESKTSDAVATFVQFRA
jgi:hypothetical protein